jgi:hypothetical protein
VEARTSVDDDACHVKTRRLRVSIAVDSNYSAQIPLFVTLGEHVLGETASAGIVTRADTLLISGRAYAPCSQLVALAFRSGRELHVQLQPESWSPIAACRDAKRLQHFVAAFLLPRGGTGIYLTNGFGDPTVLFAGSIWVE